MQIGRIRRRVMSLFIGSTAVHYLRRASNAKCDWRRRSAEAQSVAIAVSLGSERATIQRPCRPLSRLQPLEDRLRESRLLRRPNER